MNFTYDGADIGKIIRKFQNSENAYSIEYLDGSTSYYTCFNSNERERIKNKMIEQAKERQEKMDVKNFNLIKNIYLGGSAVSSLAISIAQNQNKNVLSCLLLISLLFDIYKYRDSSKKIRELKKYKLFLELLPYLNEVNTSEFLKCVEFDNIYQTPVDITTLDEYSYSQIKTIYKTYKEKSKKAEMKR